MNISPTTAKEIVALLSLSEKVITEQFGSLYYENKARKMRLMIKKLKKPFHNND